MPSPRFRRRAPHAGRLAGLALLALGPVLAWAQAAPARYELDPVHTRVLFAVEHAGFSQALGAVSGSTGTLEFDPQDWSGARLDVTVPLQRLDLGDEAWNRATLARRLLDAERWPQARYVSDRIEPIDADRFIVHGRLTLRGVTRELPLDVRFNALRRHPMPPFRRTAGFSATAVLERGAFGIDAWPSMIGKRVELRIEAEAVRVRGGTDEAEEAAPTPPRNDPDAARSQSFPDASPPPPPDPQEPP